jgi:hypothetical protein
MRKSMNPILFADVVEISLLHLPNDKVTTTITTNDILMGLKVANPCAYDHIDPADVKQALQRVFKVHKNPRARTKAFKIRYNEAEKFLGDNGIITRPLEHARKSLRMEACLCP